MKILVMGSGGVGGFFGALLARSGEEVWFTARGSHLDAMKKDGLHVNSSVGQWTIPGKTIVGDPNVVGGPVDLILFCVKTYDTKSASSQLEPVLSPQTVVLSLQNGVENEALIRETITQGIVLGGVAYVSARITAPGEITESGGFSRIVFGPFGSSIDNQSRNIEGVFHKAGIRAELKPEIETELWRKFAFITSMGSMTAMTRLNHGEMLASPETMETVFEALKETEAVALAKKVNIEPLIPEKMVEGLRRFDPGTRSSMHFDLINGKPLEIEALNGAVVRMGHELHVPTPVHKTIVAALLPYHRRHRLQ